MALHLNLYHEIIKDKRAKSRDPLKLSMIGIAVVAALFAGFYLWQLGRMSSISSELARKKAEYDQLAPKAQAAKVKQEELAVTLATRDALVKRIEGRFYWAPVLEQLSQLVPPEVQITKMAGDVQGDTVKKCNLTIDGVSAGPDPRSVAEALRTAIAEEFGKRYKNVSSTFRSLDDGLGQVRLADKQWPTATFAINFQLTSGEDALVAPPARRKK